MKKFTKLFLSCALVSVVAAASATLAMAAEGDVALTGDLTNSVYNPTSNTITIASDDVPGIVPNTQATYLVVEGTDKVEGAIEGIDQATGVAFDKTGLKNNPDGTNEKSYTVYVGYYKGTAEENTFTIVTGKLYGSSADTITVLIGDTSLNTADNKALAVSSATNIARKAMKYDQTHAGIDVGHAGEKLTISDSNYTQEFYYVGSTSLSQEGVAVSDATNVARKAMKYDQTHAGTDVKLAGQEITVEAPAAE